MSLSNAQLTQLQYVVNRRSEFDPRYLSPLIQQAKEANRLTNCIITIIGQLQSGNVEAALDLAQHTIETLHNPL